MARQRGSKELVAQLAPHRALYRDADTGLAWVEDGTTGLGYSAHPNIGESGSEAGMKARGFWAATDRCVRSHGFIYNVSRRDVDPGDANEVAAGRACRCVGCRGKEAGGAR